ncbi:caffeine-induced death protein 2-domain-containing protein [Amanita rubescens]|nr:caffeine-induced death protein 2-domain-containing protein [Amanita rubescens]
MPSKQPQLGSLAVQAPSATPQVVHVSPSTCHDLSLFKELLKEYRRLDDAIPMRLNRTNAAMRDRQRSGDQVLAGNVQDEACAYLWRELVANWKRRTQLIEYCVGVVDQSVNEKKGKVTVDDLDPSSRRKLQTELFAEEVKRNQVRNEITVESIIRQRSIDAFRARCRYFTPPGSDEEARKMWESALR